MHEPTVTPAAAADADPRPTLSARDLSYHEALAGIAAREAAAAAGGSPEQRRALVHAATGGPPPPTLRGHPLRSDDLLVTLCMNLHATALGADPRVQLAECGAARMQAVAALAYIFTHAEAAYDLLDAASDPTRGEAERATAARAFRAAALNFAGGFGPAEIETLTAHLLHLAGYHPPAEDDTEDDAEDDAAGKPSRREPSSRTAPAPPAAG